MNIEDLENIFTEFEDEHGEFERIKDAPYKRSDLCAFIKLHELVPGDDRIIAAAEHDEIYFDIELDDLATAAIKDDIIYLIRCGVRITDCGLGMFV